MLSDFAQETLDLAQSLTAHRVEVNTIWTDEDYCVLHLGEDCTVRVVGKTGQAELEAGVCNYEFGNLAAAIQAADKYETLMFAIGCLAKASRQTQEVA